MNIINYVRSQMDDFKTSKFNLVDSLVLSQFSYINFKDVLPGITDDQSPVRIGDLLMAEHFKEMLLNVRYPNKNKKLLFALGMSPRFRNIRMCFFADSVSIEEEKQFAAVTYLLDDETAYVAYRGTDTTFVGWKEDFNMAFIAPIPAQREGVTYLNYVGERLPHRLLVGGHSKGGNVAVYSSMECHISIQDRIIGVYTHDGLGFKDEVFSSENYLRIKDRIHKTIPQFSLVGMLLQHQEDYLVVESKQFWFMQHDPFSWVVGKDDFKYAQGITEGAEHFNKVKNS